MPNKDELREIIRGRQDEIRRESMRRYGASGFPR